MSNSRMKNNGRKEAPGGYAGIPRIVMQSPDFIQLNGTATKLLLALAYQYKGKNNGDLSVAWSLMKAFGFNSEATLSRAVKELLDAGLIIRTREGRFLNPGGQCALYALSWQPIDECQGKRLEVKPSITPPRKFSLELSKIAHSQN